MHSHIVIGYEPLPMEAYKILSPNAITARSLVMYPSLLRTPVFAQPVVEGHILVLKTIPARNQQNVLFTSSPVNHATAISAL